MPFRPVERTLLDASGRPLTRYETRLEEPASGTANGTAVPFTYTPREDGERLVARHRSGPTGRVRLDVREGAGAYANAANGIALPDAGDEFAGDFRPVALAFVGDDSEPTTLGLVVVGVPGAGNWRGV